MNNLNISFDLFGQQFAPENIYYTQAEVWDGEKTVIRTNTLTAYKSGSEVFVVRSEFFGNNGFDLLPQNERINDDECLMSATVGL